MQHLIIIGSAKSGTTTLYNWLLQSASILGASQKEIRYFSGPHGCRTSYSEYLQYWDQSRTAMAQADSVDSSELTLLEASTGYAKYPQYPSAGPVIASYLPTAKLIYIMRDPLKRIVSHYNFWYLNRQRINSYKRQRIAPPSIRTCLELGAISDYWLQLSFYRHFWNASQLLLIDFKQMTQDPLSTVKQVCEFAGITEPKTFESSVKNVTNSDFVTPVDTLLRSSTARQLFANVPVSAKQKLRQLELKYLPKKRIGNTEHYLQSLDPADEQYYRDLLGPSMQRLHSEFGVSVEQWGF